MASVSAKRGRFTASKKRERAAAERGRSKRNRLAFERLRLAMDGDRTPRRSDKKSRTSRSDILQEAVEMIAELKRQVIALGGAAEMTAMSTEHSKVAADVGFSASSCASSSAPRLHRGTGGDVASTEIASLLHNLAAAKSAPTSPAMAFVGVVAPPSSLPLPVFSALPSGHELQRARTIIEEQEGWFY